MQYPGNNRNVSIFNITQLYPVIIYAILTSYCLTTLFISLKVKMHMIYFLCKNMFKMLYFYKPGWNECFDIFFDTFYNISHIKNLFNKNMADLKL